MLAVFHFTCSRTLWYVHNETQRSNMAVMSKEENREFMAFFPDIVKDLTEATHCTDFPEVSKRFAKVIEYTVPNGKKIRSWAMVASYKLLEKPERITPEKLRLAFILGWCIEVVSQIMYLLFKYNAIPQLHLVLKFGTFQSAYC